MKKRIKTKRSAVSAFVNQDIAGLLTTLVQKITSFEQKVDTVLSRLPQQPVVVPRQQPAPAYQVQRPRNSRPMYRAICADCGRNCEVPFKPSGDRPVYCKGCFAARKNKGSFKPRADSRPKVRLPVYARFSETAKASEPARPVRKKKSTAKKKI